jgi:hypothetical protein
MGRFGHEDAKKEKEEGKRRKITEPPRRRRRRRRTPSPVTEIQSQWSRPGCVPEQGVWQRDGAPSGRKGGD